MERLPEILSLAFSCAECRSRVVVTIKDLTDGVPEAAQWTCPASRAVHELPMLGQVVKTTRVD